MSEDSNSQTDSNVASSQFKSRRKRKSTAGSRTIQHVWTDDEVFCLIMSVEQHRGLWDIASPEYKLAKRDEWRRVSKEIAIDGVDEKEAKTKWLSLRTTYMVNLAKVRKRVETGAKEPYNVAWKFYKAMMFLEDINLQYSNMSTSTPHLASGPTNYSTVEEFPVPSSPSVSEVINSNSQKRSVSRSPAASPPPTPPGSSSCYQTVPTFNSSVAALHSSDTNSTFCDNLLAELRTLSDLKARTLRYKIARLMMDFMEANQEPTTNPPLRIIDQNGHEF